MNKFKTFLYSVKRTLFDPLYYGDILTSSFWFSFKYLWMFLTIILIMHAVQLGIGYGLVRKEIPVGIQKVEKAASNFYPNELELRISNGRLYTNVEEPYAIDAPSSWGTMDGRHLIVIDTKGAIDNYPEYNTWILATRTALVYPDSSKNGKTANSHQLFYFSELKRSLYIDKSIYTSLLKEAHPFILKLPFYIDIAVACALVFMTLLGGFFWEIGVLFGLVFLTGIVWFIAWVMRSGLTYKSLFKMGMHGISWAILADQIMGVTSQQVPYAYAIVYILWMIVVMVSLKKAK